MRVVIDQDIPFIRGVLEPYAEVRYERGVDISAQMLEGVDALIVRTRTRCNEALLGGSSVRFIATATIGTDHIDMDYCSKRGIKVYNARGCNARGVLQWVAAALRHVVMADGKSPEEYTLGVVGVGSVGSLVSEYASSWGFKVLECDPPRKEREGGDFRSIEELAERCDILTFHTPLDSSTYHLLDDTLLAKLRPEATILNASRGGVVDNSLLANSSHRYIFDVWENEPMLDARVLANSALATPHVAGYSLQGKANATAMVISAVAQYFGLPIVDWYPAEVEPTKIRKIDWKQMCDSIEKYYPISEESAYLKSHAEEFEKIRNSYSYRNEYF